MKRHSITSVIQKVQHLTLRGVNLTADWDKYYRWLVMIQKAATSEILRLEAEAELAVERAIPKWNNEFDNIDNS